MPDTRILYTLLIVLVVLERLVELALTARNRRWALDQGGVEVGEDHYRWMVVVHTLFLVACPAEVWLLSRPFVPTLAAAALVAAFGAMALRYWAIAALGRRWTTRVICVPGLPVVTGGPYRWLRHPNYLAVMVEIAALPIIHSAWITATVFTVLNAWVLRTRIDVEERALRHYNDYATSFPASGRRSA